MTDHDALLQAVLAAPEDDLPRLVFADFLEESGHPANVARAQFIRLQIEFAQESSPYRVELEKQANELRPMFEDEWDIAKAEHLEFQAIEYYWRGFVDVVKTGATNFAAVGSRMLAIAPISDLCLLSSNHTEVWKRALNVPMLGRIPHLKLRGAVDSLSYTFSQLLLPALVESLHLTGLRRLTLTSNNLDDASIVAMISHFPVASFMPTLTELNLSGNRITVAGANALSTGRGLDRLTLLDLRDNRLTADGIAMLRRRFGERVVV